jgi:hypothetical protein
VPGIRPIITDHCVKSFVIVQLHIPCIMWSYETSRKASHDSETVLDHPAGWAIDMTSIEAFTYPIPSDRAGFPRS